MNEAKAPSRGGRLKLLRLLIPALFVAAALCPLSPQSSRADDQPAAGTSDEASLAAALKRLSVAGNQSVESDASAMKAYATLGLISEERPQMKIDQFYDRQGIPVDEEVKRSLAADLLRREVEDCRRSGKPNDDCLKAAVSRMKKLGGRAGLMDQLVASIEKSPLERLRAMKPLAMSADPRWPEVKPQRGPTGESTTSEPNRPAQPTTLTLKGHTDTIDSAAFTSDGRLLATSGADKSVRLWDTETGASMKIFEGYGRSLGAVVFSPDGKTAASHGSDNAVKVWDVSTGVLKQSLANQGGPLAFSPDGNTLAAQSYNNGARGISLWDVRAQTLQQTLSHELFVYPYSVRDVAFSPDGNTVIVATGLQSQSGQVVLVDARTGTLQKQLTGHANIVQRLAISPDGKTLASASLDGTILLWDFLSGQQKQALKANTLPTVLAFSPDGQTLASGTSSGVRLWNVQTGTLKQTMDVPWSVAIRFSPDAKTVIVASTSSNDVTVRRESVN